MAFARIEIIEGWSEHEKTSLLDGVRLALADTLCVPHDDPTVILTELCETNVIRPRQMSVRYTIITVTMFAGRTEDTKRRLLAALTDAADAAGATRSEVDVVLQEPAMGNWFRGGTPATDTDLDFEVGI